MTPTLRTEASRLWDSAEDLPEDAAFLANHATRKAHELQHNGQPAGRWGPWLALAAQAFAESDQVWFAATLGVITGTYDKIKPQLSLPNAPPARADQHALGVLLGWFEEALPVPTEQRLQDVADGYDELYAADHYAILVGAIQTQDWPTTLRTLDVLAELAEDPTGSWDAETLPGYEPAPTAIVAFARDKGLALEDLGARSRQQYWPAFLDLKSIDDDA